MGTKMPSYSRTNYNPSINPSGMNVSSMEAEREATRAQIGEHLAFLTTLRGEMNSSMIKRGLNRRRNLQARSENGTVTSPSSILVMEKTVGSSTKSTTTTSSKNIDKLDVLPVRAKATIFDDITMKRRPTKKTSTFNAEI